MVRAERRAGRCRRGGAVAVEFAIIAPTLVFLVFAGVDYGRFAYTAVAVAQGARAGASYGAFHYYDPNNSQPWYNGCTNAAKNEMADFNPALITVTPTPVRYAAIYYRSSVQVSYPFNTILTWPGLPNQITLTETVVMSSVQQQLP
jgi:hypothetical protein